MFTLLTLIGVLPLAVLAALTLVPVALLRISVARANRYDPRRMLRFPKSLPDCNRTRRAA